MNNVNILLAAAHICDKCLSGLKHSEKYQEDLGFLNEINYCQFCKNPSDFVILLNLINYLNTLLEV